ncbi:MAG: AlkA N-terminal domain-containing protein [Candidatus Eisenbacteria bacterium]|uniref:DNA-3-methyladenine glycosylase II n=1 Tax=Eiseniibacteriota bacterium TaxID=2212470 RepID=A0A956LW78_UNCEI|nr:DNA-3-methyladenine glycosylase 2 family protein [Candidatus Eisenbacteria bacterium]
MTEDTELCYRALVSRDRRFDGRFFTGVRTTGIYCRPICPARTPRRENVEFYPCAAAAEAAGYRPCLRCRPDSAPGTPEWNGTSATVSRGLRLIQQGELDERGVSGLAARLGIGERHLSRLFEEHLGAAPVVVAQTRRAHFARKLIEETDLPMADIAFASGFGSIRRFNALVRDRFGYPPTELRGRWATRRDRASRASRNLGDGTLTLRLPYRPPLDWEGALAFLAKRTIPGVERVGDGAYERTFELEGHSATASADRATGTFRVIHAEAESCLLLSVSPIPARAVLSVVETVRHLFDLHADPMVVSRHFANDTVLGPLVSSTPGLRLPGSWDGFELAIRAILGQQITVRAATTIAGRLVDRMGRPVVTGDSSLSRLFPSAAEVAAGDLSGLGIPGSRIRALRALAEEVAEGRLTLDPAADPAETRAKLLALPGIGPWTVEYIMMRALRDPNAFPAGDIVLRKALSGSDRALSERQLLSRAEPWRPWRAYAVLHLWRASGTGRTVGPVSATPSASVRSTTKTRRRKTGTNGTERKSHAQRTR